MQTALGSADVQETVDICDVGGSLGFAKQQHHHLSLDGLPTEPKPTERLPDFSDANLRYLGLDAFT